MELAAQSGKEEFHHYKIDLKSEKVDYFDLIESVEICRIEETESSLISSAQLYFKTPDGFGIADNKSHMIHVFDENGDVVSSFSANGWGPKEYQHLAMPWVKDGHLEIFDWATRKLIKYTFEGEFLESITVHFPFRVLHTYPYKDGYMMSRVPAGMAPDTTAGHSILFLNERLEILEGAFPYEKSHPFPMGLGGYYMKEGAELLHKKMVSDSLFRVVDYKMIPFMKFDFGKEWTWSKPGTMLNLDNAAEEAFSGRSVFEMIVKVGEELIDIAYYKGLSRNPDRGYINRKTGRFFRYDLRMNRKEKFKLIPIEWQGGLLLHSLDSDQLERFIEKLDDKPFKVRGGYSIEDIMESENPVLVFIRFKSL